jgi:hypothetical protein
MLIKGEQGELIIKTEEILKSWKDIFTNLLNNPQPIGNQASVPNPTEGTDDQETQPPTYEEFNNAIQKLKNNKAAGSDNIISEFLKHERYMLKRDYII